MASWLKAAEDLFEVVDRRAKLVVGELSEEQSESQLPVSSGKGSQGKRSRTKTKGRQKLLTNKTSKTNDSAGDPSGSEVSQPDASPSKDSVFTGGPSLSESVSKTTKHHKQTATDVHNIPAPEESVEDTKTDAAGTVAPPTVADGNATEDASLSTTNIVDGDAPNDPLAHQSPTPLDKEIEVAGDEHLGDPPHSSIPGETALPVSPLDDGKVVQHKDAEAIVDTSKNLEKDQEQKANTSPMKIQDQLEEAQGLLKTAVSTGQSKEARLARVCAGLSSRLQEYKAENAQLEELLTAERELTKSCEAHIKQLQKDLSASKSEVTKVETGMAEALAAKNSEIEALVSAMDALKRQAALTEGNLASLQGDMDSIMRNRELTETRMMQALREELATAERRAEEERVAHSATKMAAMEREVELEHRALEASTALARIQRLADERMAKVAELEQKVALLEVECSSLNQELQDMEARARRGQKKSPEEANQVIQVQAWQEEVERARQGQRDAEEKLSSMEAETQKLRVEVAAMKRDAEHYSRQEHMELEKRYRELTDLLYYKQTQLETMASEKAAAEFQLEKEMKRQQEAQVEAERSRVSRRTSATWEEDAEMKALEPLPLYHRHMTTATLQLQKAAKLLDSGAVRATRFLWRYPTARVILLFYLVFVHLFLMYLLHRLQEQADGLAALEVAESMGLANPIRP